MRERGISRWRVIGAIALILFAVWTTWTVVSILAEGPESRTSRDTRGGRAEQVTVAAVGDIGSDNTARATLDEMASTDPDVYLALGDLSCAGPGSEAEWCALVRSRIGPVAPFEMVAGNHEDDTGEDGLIGNFISCLPDRLNSVGFYGVQYYFDLGTLARFILISPDLTIGGSHYFYGSGNANMVWLEQAIDDARSRGIKWIVVGMHKNCISIGEYYCDVEQELFSFLIEKRVDLVLSGHDHTYQRSKQIAAPRRGCEAALVDDYDRDCVVDGDDQYRKGAGTAFVISGAGGGELYALHPNDPEAGYFVETMGANADGRHGFVTLRLSLQRLTVRFVGSTPGSFTDEFSLLAAPREGAPDG